MNYREGKAASKAFKEEYLAGIRRVIQMRRRELANDRADYAKDIFTNPEKYRCDFRRMLGWPLVGDCSTVGVPPSEFIKLSDEDGYSVYRVRFEVLDGLKMTGLLFKRQASAALPMVIVQHGGLGTPELISGVYDSTGNYNDMLQRVIKTGVHAFAPQLLLWEDSYEVEFDRRAIDAQLKRVGSSITAIEIFSIMRIIDYFEAQDFVSSFGMVGLSYGGFYTLYTAAVDTRIKSAISCSFFNTRDEYDRSDWTWFNSAQRFDDAEIAALVYPRSLCIEIGSRDELFDYNNGVRSFERLKELSENVGDEWVNLTVFDGMHEFCRSDEPIEKLAADLMQCGKNTTK